MKLVEEFHMSNAEGGSGRIQADDIPYWSP